MKSVLAITLAAALWTGVLQAQISVPRLPKRGTQPGSTNSALKLVDQTGSVVNIQDGNILIELSDSRLLTFKTSPATKFIDGLTLAGLGSGDRIRIQGTQDAEAYLMATTVSKDAGSQTAPATDASSRAAGTAANTAVRKPAALDPSDDGPPVLKRGKPSPRKSTAADDEVEIASTPKAPDSSLKGPRPVADSEVYETPKVAQRNLDPREDVLERAREWALSFTSTLPNYVAQQFTTRYIRVPGSKDWRAQDVVSANVVYENGKEDYRNVAINGKAINKRMEDLPGSWSTGEFGTTLRSLFHPGRRAQFTYVKQSQMNGVSTMVYDYKVRKEASDWRIQLGSQSIIPAYVGRVWIDAKTAGVMRIEMAASEIPPGFPLDQVEASNDYGLVRLATTDQYLLPTHAETLSCERGSPICSRNTIEFRNYHKFAGDSVITFDKN